MASLTFNQNFPLYQFSRNKHYISVTTDHDTYSVNLGTKAHCYFSNLQNAIVDDILYIAWGTSNETITFKTATDIGNNEVAKAGSGQDSYEYIAQLANDLNTHTVLNTVFEFQAFQNSLFIIAKSAGSAYNLGASTTDVSNAGFYVSNGVDDVQTILRPGYKIEIELYGRRQTTDGWTLLKKFSQEPYDHKIQFDLQQYINDYLEYNLPPFNNPSVLNDPFLCTKAVSQFRLVTSQLYGEPPEAEAFTANYVDTYVDNKAISTAYWVLKSGFDEVSSRRFPIWQFLYLLQGFKHNFLTTQNRSKKIVRNQREWLYLLFFSSYSNPGIRAKFYIQDELVDTVVYKKVGSIVAYQLVAWCVNGPSHGLDIDSRHTKMEVEIYNEDTDFVISEKFTYHIDDAYYPESTYIYFAGSKAGCDTLRCTGFREALMDFDSESVERTRALTDTVYDGDVKQLFIEKRNRHVIHTGWRRANEMAYLEEVIMSPVLFFYENKYQNSYDEVIPVKVLNKTMVRSKTNEFLYGYVLELEETIRTEVPQSRFYPIITA